MILQKDLPIDLNYPQSCVYWIHSKNTHTDPSSQGYVGVSSNGVEARMYSHNAAAFTNNSKYIVHCAMRKYGEDICVKVLLVADPELCLLFEGMLRPSKCIGWNIMEGGSLPPSQKGRKRSFSTISKIKAATKSKKQSQETLDARFKNIRMNPWATVRAHKATWELASKMYAYYHKGFVKQHELAKLVDVSPDSMLTIHKKLKAGWNPSEDSLYLEWLKQYRKRNP